MASPLYFNTFADWQAFAAAGSIDPAIVEVRTLGYYAHGDGGGARYRRRSTAPAHAEFLPVGSVFFEMMPSDEGVLRVSTLGARAVNQDIGATVASDFTVYMNKAHTYWANFANGAPYSYPRVRVVQLDPGWYACNTRPADFPAFTTLEWRGTPFTTIYKNFPSASGQDGIFNVRGGATQCVIRQINLGALAPSAGTGCLISAVSNAAGNVGRLHVIDCNCAPTNHARLSIYGSGLVTSNPPGVGGIRVIYIENCEIFAATYAAIELLAAGAVAIRDCNFPGSGGTSAHVYIGGTSGFKSQNVRIDGSALSGVTLGWVQNAFITCPNVEKPGNTAVYFEQTSDIRLDLGLVNGNVVGYNSTGVRLKATRVLGSLLYNGAPWSQTNGEWAVP